MSSRTPNGTIYFYFPSKKSAYFRCFVLNQDDLWIERNLLDEAEQKCLWEEYWGVLYVEGISGGN